MDGYTRRLRQTLPASEEPFDDPVGQVAGFSLHAGVAAKAHQRQKPTPEASTAVPLHLTPCGVTEAPVAHPERQHSLPAQDAVPRRHHPCHL